MPKSYKLSYEAKEDLRRIYHYGLKNWGEEQADKYYFAFFNCFEQIAEKPTLYQAVDHIRNGYKRSVCGVDNIYFRVNENTVEIMSIIGQQDI